MSAPSHFEDVVVIGAGYAGATAAAYLTKAGRRVTLLEGHATPGGCAGFFKRNGFSFDVGATTLNGLGEGLPLARLSEDFQFESKFEKVDPAVHIHMDGQVVKRFTDIDSWSSELAPLVEDRSELLSFLHTVERKSEEFWQIATGYPLSPYGISDYFKYVGMGPSRLFSLLGGFLSSIESRIPERLKRSPQFMRLVNELLLISAQGYADKCPAVVGFLGLGYMSDMYYPWGGISSMADELCHKIKSYGGSVSFNDPARSVKSVPGGYEVQSRKGSLQTRAIVFAVPIWNVAELLGEMPVATKVDDKASKQGECWSAITATMGLRFIRPVEGLYHQVHIQNAPPEVHSGSLFVSVSHPDDRERAPEGFRSVTVSTHAQWVDFSHERTTEEYQQQKQRLGQYILDQLKGHFPIDEESVVEFRIGTPRTFNRFTRRYNGWVGGIPWKAGSLPLGRPGYRLPGKELYLIGDTALPGQGVSGVVLGAQSLADRLLG